MHFRNSRSPVLFTFVILTIFFSCGHEKFQKEAGAFEAFAEMVQAGNKPLALSHPMSAEDLQMFWPEAEKIAAKYGVEIFRESDLIESALFDLEGIKDMEVILIYSGDALDAYQFYKEQISALDPVKDEEQFLAVSRSFGRLLGYPNSRINDLLAQNSNFRDLQDFGISGQELIWFYRDLPAAKAFYSETLGLKLLEEEQGTVTFQIAGDSRLVLKSVSETEYSGKEAKSVALALLSDNLPAWYAHLQEQKVEIKYTLKVLPEGAHDGFVAVDPEGYLLEFEMFRQHPENEKLMPELRNMAPQTTTLGGDLNFYGSVTWLYYVDMLPMENFMTEDLGLVLSADQGWAKIYRVSENSYLGLVDEKRGMNTFSEEKLVEVKFDLSDPQGWEGYLKKSDQDSSRMTMTFKDPGGYLFRFE